MVMLQVGMVVLPDGVDVLPTTRPMTILRGGAVGGAAMELQGLIVWVLRARGGWTWGLFPFPLDMCQAVGGGSTIPIPRDTQLFP
jgi:hypothetical protein